MIPKLESYNRFVGKKVTKEIRHNAETLQGKHLVHINATPSGGGVAEILNSLVFLMNDVGIDTGWRVLIGSHSFFSLTKKFHNSLQGKKVKLTENRRKIYMEYTKKNSMINHISKHDFVVIHDPQPLGMISHFPNRKKWIWRCHIDISNPHTDTFDFILPFVRQYDCAVVSSNRFKINSLEKPQFIIPPSIDPLAAKNKQISENLANKVLSKHGIDVDKPILSQVARFDPWKGHLGVIKMFKKIKEKMDCQLIFMGDMASDDPQGPILYHRIRQITDKYPDIHTITQRNDLLVNALQKKSAIVFQNSVKEGFGLTVAEAMWKKTPVLGTDVGGIPLQILDGQTGYILKSVSDGVAKSLKILEDNSHRNELGSNAYEHVRKNFLITRHLNDYINMLNTLNSS